MTIFLNLLLIPTIIIISFIIATVYKFFYNKHINSNSSKKWVSPSIIGVLSFVLFTTIIIIAFSYGVSYNDVHISEPFSITLTEQDFNKPEYSEYTKFNGLAVDGYTIINQKQKDFTYQLYTKKENGQDLEPDFVIIITYTGDKTIKSVFAENSISDKTGGSSWGTSIEKSSKYIAIINKDVVYTNENGDILNIKNKHIYKLKLYNKKTNDFDIKPISEFVLRLY